MHSLKSLFQNKLRVMQIKLFRIEFKWAFILFFIQLFWFALERALGLHGENIHNYFYVSQLIAIAYAIIYYLALKEKRKKVYKGFMLYDQALATGLRLTFAILILTPISHFLLIYIISPNYLSSMKALSIARHEFDLAGASKHYSIIGSLIQSIVYYAIIGILTSLVISLFTYKKTKQ